MVARRKSKPKRKAEEPLDVHLTVRFRFGDEADDQVTMMEDRRVPMVGSIFEKRDAVLKHFVRLMVFAASKQPKVVRELIPATRLLRRS